MTDRERLGRAVARVREARGVSQDALASRLGATLTQVKLLEEGIYTDIRLEEVAEVLDMPKEVLALLAVDPSGLSEIDRKMTEKLTELAWALVGLPGAGDTPEEKP